MGYSLDRRSAVLKRMLPPNNVAIRQLSQEEGISEATLHKWRADARGKGQLLPDADARPEGWSSRDKFAAVLETAALNEADLAEYCRKRGLYPAQIAMWRVACEQANDWDRTSAARLGRATKEDKKRVKDLERELARKDRALAETAALLVLRKRPQRSGGTERTHDQHPRSPNRNCSDQRGRHRRSAARQSLFRVRNQRTHSAALDKRRRGSP